MKRALIGVLLLCMLAACERHPDPEPLKPKEPVLSPKDLDERLLTKLESRRQWSTSGVKVNLKRPTISVPISKDDGQIVTVHAWGANENDFNVAMMRLDSALVLYAITEAEWKELQR